MDFIIVQTKLITRNKALNIRPVAGLLKADSSALPVPLGAPCGLTWSEGLHSGGSHKLGLGGIILRGGKPFQARGMNNIINGIFADSKILLMKGAEAFVEA